MRFHDWEKRLADYIAASATTRFRYGLHDCCLFSTGAIQAITGVDIMKGWRGYRGIKQAQKLLSKYGGLEATGSQVLSEHFAEVGTLAAQRGDIVFASLDRPSFGICNGAISAFVSPHGVRWIPTLLCRRAWRIA